MPDTPYYFEVLPIHPKPEWLESLTSYLIRLGESNRIQSVRNLSSILFPSQDTGWLRSIADYPPVRLEPLSRATYCSDAGLRETTFYHLSRKFARSTHPQAVSRFLSDSVAVHLRFCPQCIAEKGYYSLLWRFTLINGCPEHNCHLVDRCGKCGSKQRFLATPLRIGICSKCGANLAECRSALLSSDDSEVTLAETRQIQFLLLPHMVEENATLSLKSVGMQLMELRIAMGMTRDEANVSSNIKVLTIINMERTPSDTTRGIANFPAYLNYARFLRVSLDQLFVNTLTRPYISKQEARHRRTALLVTAVEDAIDHLMTHNIGVTSYAIAEITGFPQSSLFACPEVMAIMSKHISKRRRYESEQLILEVKHVVQEFRAGNQKISGRSVASVLGVTRAIIHRSPELMAIIQGAKEK